MDEFDWNQEAEKMETRICVQQLLHQLHDLAVRVLDLVGVFRNLRRLVHGDRLLIFREEVP